MAKKAKAQANQNIRTTPEDEQAEQYTLVMIPVTQLKAGDKLPAKVNKETGKVNKWHVVRTVRHNACSGATMGTHVTTTSNGQTACYDSIATILVGR